VSATVYVPKDAGALSLGAGEVAAAIAAEAGRRKLGVNLVRNGSRGAYWLEPMVEVETAAGRVAYGPVAVADVASLFAADFLSGAAHPLAHGATDGIAWFASASSIRRASPTTSSTAATRG
jgi:formate dehydrogenase iron-sulfur subunit